MFGSRILMLTKLDSEAAHARLPCEFMSRISRTDRVIYAPRSARQSEADLKIPETTIEEENASAPPVAAPAETDLLMSPYI